MTNAELITELTYHASIEKRKLLSDAADALEAAEQRISDLQKQVNEFIKNETHSSVIKAMSRRIEELEAQMPKEGEWIEHRSWGFCYGSPLTTNYHCSICDHEESHNKYHYCPNCGAKMKGENDER